jgi:hypothetical protein
MHLNHEKNRQLALVCLQELGDFMGVHDTQGDHQGAHGGPAGILDQQEEVTLPLMSLDALPQVASIREVRGPMLVLHPGYVSAGAEAPLPIPNTRYTTRNYSPVFSVIVQSWGSCSKLAIMLLIQLHLID